MTDLRTRAPQAPPRQRPRVTRRTLVLAGAAVVVAALVLIWAVAFSPLFGVRDVQVRGVSGDAAKQVERVADVGHGTPLVRLDTASVARRVRTIADVATVQVDTSFPSTVTIRVTPRTPVGYVALQRGDVLVDRTGAQYRTVAEAPAHLPRFVLPTGSAARPTAVALGVVAGSLTAQLRSVVTSVQALDTGSITVTVRGRDGDVVVRWGSSDASALKARVLPALLNKHPTLIDLTDPHQPFVR